MDVPLHLYKKAPFVCFKKALKSTEREEEEELNTCIQVSKTESALEPLISEIGKSQYLDEPSQLQELVAVVDQVHLLYINS